MFNTNNIVVRTILGKSIIFIEPVFYFWRGLSGTIVFQSFLILMYHAFKYVTGSDVFAKVDFVMTFGLYEFAMFALNVSLIYMFTLVMLRGLISPLIFMITTLLYAAAVKYLTGSLFFGFEINTYMIIVPVGGYIYIMAYLNGLLRGELQSAITYRTTSNDD